jgi:hypothetical protein
VVLRSSAQCVPLIQFTCEPDGLLSKYHKELQSLVDVFFNGVAPASATVPGTVGSVTPTVSFGAPLRNQFAAQSTAFPAQQLVSAGLQTRSTLAALTNGSSIQSHFGLLPQNPVAFSSPSAPVASTHVGSFRPSTQVSSSCFASGSAAALSQSPTGSGGLNVTSPAFIGNKTVHYVAPKRLAVHRNTSFMVQHVPIQRVGKDTCAICLVALQTEEVGALCKCQHQFHYICISAALQHSTRCPLCSAQVVEPEGTMPSGDMHITVKPSMTCGGFGPGTIEIKYHIPNGIQKAYHR